MPTHVVAQGECTSSIADACGLSWETIWNHPQNATLRQKRKDPNVLYPGDELFVPEVQVKWEKGPTGQRHTFTKKTVKVTIHLRVLDADKPRANVPYTLIVDGTTLSGNTDGGGFLKQTIPANATRGELSVGTGATKDTFELLFGTVDPIDTDEGIAGRLQNLGFVTDNLSEAISAFQRKEKLTVSGDADAATRARLQEKFGQ
jgi:hypothetical protein